MSGSHRSGSHRAVRPRGTRGRWALVVGGVGAVIAVCVLAAFVVLAGVGTGGDDRDGADGRAVGAGPPETSTMSRSERTTVPDSCTIVGQPLVDRLAPGSERTEADSTQRDDRQNQCVWGAYTGEVRRQLTIELRAIAGSAAQTPTQAARATFASERTADESGKALLAGRKLTAKTRLTGVGDDGYVVYSVDDGQGSGEAIGNVRSGNVLVTVHYSGSDGGDPLSSRAATDGTVEAAKAVLQGLARS